MGSKNLKLCFKAQLLCFCIALSTFCLSFANASSETFLKKTLQEDEDESHEISLKNDTNNNNNEMVRFFLYNNPLNFSLRSGINVESSNGSINFLDIRPNRTTKFIIHGFEHNYSCWFPQEIKDAYLERRTPDGPLQDNIITVDWGSLVAPENSTARAYWDAVHNIDIAADEIASFISKLREDGLIANLSQIHLIGFSLGAHLAGRVGHKLFHTYHEKVGRITALDPAGPLFMSGWFAQSLKKTDADYVDVYHTDMLQKGLFDTVGDADFYINSGFGPQPGCSPNNSSCSHAAAPNYFWQSILDRNITACPCGFFEHFMGTCDCKCDPSKRIPFGENSVPGKHRRLCVDLEQKPLSGKYTC